MNIGESVKEIRLKRGLTQMESCKKTGFKQSYLSLVESGKREPSREYLIALARAYDVPLIVFEFMSVNINDVQKSKRAFFKSIKPEVDKMILSLI
jgi:transcriptional regulator with XRE-family HTH domain